MTKEQVFQFIKEQKTAMISSVDDEESFLISEPEKPGNKGKFVVVLLPEW